MTNVLIKNFLFIKKIKKINNKIIILISDRIIIK